MVAHVEQNAQPAERDDTSNASDTSEASESSVPNGGFIGLIHRLAPARLTSRIVLINLLGLVILVTGILYFNQSRQSLIDARVESLMTQAHIIAAAVAGAAAIDTGQIIIDPELLLDQQLRNDGANNLVQDVQPLEFQISPERAGPVLRRLMSSTNTRARLFDRDGLLVVDSRYYYGQAEIQSYTLPPIGASQTNFFTRWWSKLNDWIFTNDYPKQPAYSLDNGKDFPEIRAALNGASVSIVRVNRKNELIVSVAVPVQRFRAVQGSLVLSTQGGEIDVVLRNERRIVFFTFLVVGVVAVLLSLALAGHIAEPIRRLAEGAEKVRRGVNARVEIPNFTHRRDEIGHLSGALRDMTEALYNRIAAIEAFAADVAHELKNPLTSLRSAVETLGYVKTDDQRNRLTEIINDDVRRLDRLISDISDASRLDAELARAHAEPVNLKTLLETVVAMSNEMHRPEQAQVKLRVEKNNGAANRQPQFMVLGHDNRLGQVVRNLIDNAVSFSPDNTVVEVQLKRNKQIIEFTVTDCGPGIEPGNFKKVFQRFYTDRPAGAFGKNSGLGLSISKQIVEAYRGRIVANNAYGPPGPSGEYQVLGAKFSVYLPASPDDMSSRPKAKGD